MDVQITHNRFKPRLYANLSVPSYAHGYSMGIEIMTAWFFSKFRPGYFKTVHIIGKHPFDDFRRFEVGDYVKRLKPAVSINPQVVFDHDREGLDLYLGDAETFIKKSNYNRSFLKDPVNNIYLGIAMDQTLMDFAFRIRLSTRAQQLDLYREMRLKFKIGGTWNFDVSMDLHLPYDIMRNVAKDAGFIVDENGTIANPEGLLKYMNQHSQIPILYKLRYINSKKEFFLRLDNCHIHISTKEKLQVDDGEMEGQMSNNFTIDFNCQLRLPTPTFYAYYSMEPTTFTINTYQDNEDTIIYDSIKLIDIPEWNNKGWFRYATSNYLPEKNEKYITEIDISELFKDATNDVKTTLDDVIQDSLNNFISPDSFIAISVYTNDIQRMDAIPLKVDWEHRKILFTEKEIYSMLYIAVYIDQEYVNERKIELDKLYGDRHN